MSRLNWQWRVLIFAILAAFLWDLGDFVSTSMGKGEGLVENNSIMTDQVTHAFMPTACFQVKGAYWLFYLVPVSLAAYVISKQPAVAALVWIYHAYTTAEVVGSNMLLFVRYMK